MRAWFAVLLLLATSCSNSSAPTSQRATAETSTISTPTTTSAPTTITPTPDTGVEAANGEMSVRTGAGVLVDMGFELIEDRRVGLISHQNSVVDGQHLADRLHESPKVELVALFGPEHGARGDADAGEYVPNAIDPTTGVPVYSLFGPTRQPTAEMLEGIDVLIYDLQDVGARYYTYISTMGLAMQAAADAGVAFVVLDRPNPIGGTRSGGMIQSANLSFVGQYEIPDLYGLTAGELAVLIREFGWMPGLEHLELSIVAMDGWQRDMRWADTGLPWVPPSPAITTANTALLYPATIWLEATSLSYGRGTPAPFEIIGAPWLDADALVRTLTDRALPGVGFEAIEITPTMLPGMTVEPAYVGETIPAVQLRVTDVGAIEPSTLGLHLLEVVFAQANTAGVDALSRPEWLDQLSGSSDLRRALQDDRFVPSEISELHARQRSEFGAYDAWQLYD